MDFNDTPEEAAFRAECPRMARSQRKADRRRTTARRRPVRSRSSREAVAVSQAWQKKKADAGWACITWPEEYGGRGATPIQSAIWAQEEAKFEVPPNIFTIGIGMCGPTILAHGTRGAEGEMDSQARHG